MKRILLGLAAAALALFSLAPFLWTILTSLKPEREVFAIPPTWRPRAVSLENYAGVFRQRPFARYLLNSVKVAAGSTALALLAGSLAAYALARGRAAWAVPVEKGIWVFALFPPVILIAPLAALASRFGLMNSHLSVMAVHAALNLPFAVALLTGFFRRLPPEIEEAARVDGAPPLSILARIILPLAAPALAAAAILVFIFSWNEFVIALTLLPRDDLRTVPVGISLLAGVTAYEIPWGQISAAVVMTTLPVVAAVLAMQRRIVGGLTAGAVKG